MDLAAEIDFLDFNELLPPHVARFYQSLPKTKLVILSDTQPRILHFLNEITMQFLGRALDAVRHCCASAKQLRNNAYR